MAVFRVERNSGYTVMSNHHLRNKELTLKAKGLLSQMLSLPEDWDYPSSKCSFGCPMRPCGVSQICPRDPGPAPQFCKIDFVYTCKLTMEFFHFCNGLCYNWQEAITLNSFHIIPFYWVVWSLFSIKDLKEFRNGFLDFVNVPKS